MQVLVGIFMVVMVLSVILPDQHQGFLTLTHVSTGILILMPSIIRRPFGHLGVFAHEVCHGVAAIATGGKFHEFHVTHNAGIAWTSGDMRIVTLFAGYVGTVLIGLYILVLASCVFGEPGVLVYILAGVFFFATFKAADVRTAIVGLVLSGMLVAATFLDLLFCAFVLNFIGVIILYDGIASLIDLHDIARRGITSGTSDIDSLSKLIGRSPAFWSLAFICVSTVAIITAFGYVFH